MPHALGPGKLYRRERRGNRAVYVLDFVDAQGRRRRQPLSSDRSAAEQIRNKLISERDLAAAGLGTVAGQSRPLTEVRDAYIADLGTRVTPSHLSNTKAALERMLVEVKVVRVRDLRPHEVLTARARLLAAGLAPRTANIHVDRLRAMLTWAVAAELIAETPLKSIARLPDGDRHQVCRRRALSDDEIARFLAAAVADDRENAERVAEQQESGSLRAARHHGVRVPQAALWRFLLESAARYGEMRTLTWGDVDLDDCVATLRAETTKAGKQRRIPIRREFADELVALKGIHERALGREPSPSERAFLTPGCKPWCVASNNLMRIFDRLLIAADIDRVDSNGRKVDVHALRHTAATRFARAGVPLIQTQRILGHSDPKLTSRIYSHLDADDLRGAVEMASGKRMPRLVRPLAAQGDGHIEASA